MPKGSILVVDDEIEIREGLEALLTSESFDVTLAENGEAGLQKLDDRPFARAADTHAYRHMAIRSYRWIDAHYLYASGKDGLEIGHRCGP